MKTVRILVADDHEVVRRGMRTLLEAQRGWKVCGEAATGREAVKQAKRLNPDVVILDITMPELDGLAATRQIRKAVPETQVLILTMHDTDDLLHEVLAAGASGYVTKSDAGGELVIAVAALRMRKPFLSSTVLKTLAASHVYKSDRSGKDWKSGDRLTRREHEVVRLLGQGESNKEIAAALGISARTVETHRANTMRKLGLHSISDLIHYTIREKIVSP